MRRTLILLAASLSLPACARDTEAATGETALRALNAGLILPEGAYQIEDPQVDATVEIALGKVHPTHFDGGTVIDRRLHYSSTGAKVVAAGFRLGRVGPICVVPALFTGGTIDFSIGLPDSLCAFDGHPVECHEFAVTAAGKVSRPRVSLVTLHCGVECRPDADARRPGHKGTVTWVDSEGEHCSREGMAVESDPIHGGEGRVLWIGARSGPICGVVLQVPLDVRAGTYDICSDARFHAQCHGELAMTAVWPGHPSGGSGVITIERNSPNRIAGSFSFTGYNVKGRTDVSVGGTFDLPKHPAAFDLGE